MQIANCAGCNLGSPTCILKSSTNNLLKCVNPFDQCRACSIPGCKMKNRTGKSVHSLRQVLGVLVIMAVALVGFKGPALAQKSEDKSEMAAADFPRLVADYLNDMHS